MAQSFALFLVLTISAVTGLLAFSFPVEGASALQTIVAECRQRTGFGESTCKTLVRKHMNVERCKEYTGYSDEECVKKIEEIKNDPEFSSNGTIPSPAPAVAKTPEPSLSGLPAITPRTSNTLAGLREKKERDLLALWKRTETMTNFLKEKGVDTRSIEAAFPEFQSRSENLLSAYDTYRAAHDGTAKDPEATRRSVRGEARENTVQSMRSLVEFYQKSILMPLRIVYEETL